MSVNNIFEWSYWFYQPFIARGWVLWVWVWLFLVLILAGMVAKIVRFYSSGKFLKEFLRRGGNMAITMGFLGLVWLFFRQERVMFLAWRFWLLLWAIVLGWWMIKIVKYWLRRVPELQRDEIKKKELNKYLPGRKE